MPRIIPFRNGRLNYSPLQFHQSRDIAIDDLSVSMALWDARGAILPPSYTANPPGVQTVPLTSIILDFSQRMVDYDAHRVRSIIVAMKNGVALPPLSVEARPNGEYKLENGYHRFLACVIIGFNAVPIDKAPLVEAPQAVASGGKYIPRHLRGK